MWTYMLHWIFRKIKVYVYIHIFIAHDFQKDEGICDEKDKSRHI